MSVNLKNPEAERSRNALAKATGETLTEAATRAFAERLERLRGEREAAASRSLGALLDLIEEARKSSAPPGPATKQLTDELWGEG